MLTVNPWGCVVDGSETGVLVDGSFPIKECKNGDYGSMQWILTDKKE
jgi:hypothetical protein